MKPLILITNDDGVSSRGLHHLVEVAQEYGDIVVMAPDHNASGLSTSITTARPLRIREVSQGDGVAVYSCDGTPADCVKMGLEHFCPRKPDLVLSGINYGSNASINIIYSGTMGATYEASLRHIPAIAFSHGSISRNIDFTSCVPYIRDIIERALRNPDALKDVCLNVNFPHDIDRFKGVKITTTARGHWENEYDHRIDPHGRDYYWLQGRYVSDNPDDHTTDFYWLRQGWITVTPCQVDQTAPQAINDIQSLLNA